MLSHYSLLGTERNSYPLLEWTLYGPFLFNLDGQDPSIIEVVGVGVGLTIESEKT